MWGVLLPLTLCLSGAASQPVGCQSNAQCREGYYCDEPIGACKKCLFCKDFNREPPSTPVSCITTVSQCGVCFKGLEEPLSGNVQEACAAGGGGAPAYLWLVAGGLALFAALIATVYCVLRKKHINIFSSTSTAVLAPRAEAPPSAPEAPPPYNSLYSALRTESPAPPAPPAHEGHEESERPFLKPGAAVAPAREAAGRQAANVFNNPNYVRGPHLPTRRSPKPESPPEPEAAADEDTVESPWTPADAAGGSSPDDSSASSSGGAGAGAGAAGGGAGGLSAALAAARGAVLLRPPADAAPPAKLPRLPQDTNNNASGHREREDAAGAPSINILVNVQQISDVKL